MTIRINSANKIERPTLPLAFFVLLSAALIGLHAIHLGADTSQGLFRDLGAYIDEGYKTLAARNLALFGTTKVDPADPYQGWIASSPLTHWPYYGAFRLFGVRAESARLVSLAFFFLFLFTCAAGLRRRYSAPVLLAGLVALGLESTLFFFSRLALFEIAITAALYCPLFAIARWPQMQAGKAVGVIILFATLASLLIKETSAIYFAPLVIAALLWLSAKGNLRIRWQTAALWALALGLSLVFFATHYELIVNRLGISVRSFVEGIVRNPLAEASPFVTSAGLFCSVHLLVCQPRRWWQDLYRLCLMSLVLVPPILLAAIDYNPPRYYVPILPASILILLEWVHLQAWKLRTRTSPGRAALFWGMLCLVFAGLLAGISLWLGRPLRLAVSAPISLVLGSLVWFVRDAAFRSNILRPVLVAALLGWMGTNAIVLGPFFAAPRYEADHIRRDLIRLIRGEDKMAGDWAPFFALGTPIRALYLRSNYWDTRRMGTSSSSPTANQSETIAWFLETIKPEFFLYSPTQHSEVAIQVIEDLDIVSLGEPVYRSTYAGRLVILYPLRWTQSPSGTPSMSSHRRSAYHIRACGPQTGCSGSNDLQVSRLPAHVRVTVQSLASISHLLDRPRAVETR